MELNNVKQAIILLEEDNSKMFPFDQAKVSSLSIGNTDNLKLIVEKLMKLEIINIHVVGADFYKEKNILRNYENINFVKTNNNVATVLSDLVEQEDTLIHSINSYVDTEDLELLIKGYTSEYNRVLLEKNTNKSFEYKDYICAQANEYVSSFYAHPRASYVNSRSTGVFIIKKEFSKYLLNSSNEFSNVNVGVIKHEGFFIEQCLNDLIFDHHKIEAVYCRKQYVNLKFPWDVLEANYLETIKIKDEVVYGQNTIIDDTVIFDGSAQIGDNCQILNGAIIGDGVIIGDNTIITNYGKVTKNSVIGRNNKIGYMAEVSGVTFDNVAIVHNSHICGLIGSNVDIGAGTNTANLRFDDLNETIVVDGRRYSNKFTNYVFIGESTRTGIGALLSPGTRIGKNAAIGSGAIVSADVANNQLLIVKQEQILKEWGSKKHGW